MSTALGDNGHQRNPKESQASNDQSGSSSGSDLDVKVAQEPVQEYEKPVHLLARKFTAQSHRSHHESPFQAQGGTNLDPNSANFNARDWAKAFYNARYSSVDVPARVAGVGFKKVNVWGIGSPTDFQSSVANSVLKLPSLFGSGAQKIEILRDLDGLVLPGEVRP